MEKLDRFGGEDFDEPTLGLSDAEIRWVGRRQLIGSLFVGAVLAAAAGLLMVRPAHLDTAQSASSRMAAVR
jgi:hypothetical protein